MSDVETCDNCGRTFRYFSFETGDATELCPKCLAEKHGRQSQIPDEQDYD